MSCQTYDIPSALWEAYRVALQDFGLCDALTGIDVGFKYSDGQRRDDLSVRFHVPRKLPMEEVPPACRVEKIFRDVLTDVIETPLRRQPIPLAVRHQRHDPIQPGLSIAKNQGATWGTLGAIVFLNDSHRAAVLSCAHLLTGTRVPLGHYLIQPFGGHWWYDSFAKVSASVDDEDGDAAIAVIKYFPRREYWPEQFESNALVRTARQVRLGECLEKSGCATGVTQGRVDGIGSYFPQYLRPSRVPLEGFRLIPPEGWPDGQPISHFGDSGAVWYSNGVGRIAEGVGLHVAGDLSSAETEYAIACHLPRVLHRLNVSLAPP